MAVRILHIVGDSKFGGAALGILRLAALWRSLEWEVDVLTTDPEFRNAARAQGLPIVEWDVIWRDIRPVRDLLGMAKLYRLLRRSDYTIVHTHTTKAGFIGRIAAWMAGVPVVVHTAHGFAFHESSSRLKIAFYTVLERIASLGCRKVVAVSRFHEQWGGKLGIAPRHKLQSIPNGIPDPLAKIESKRDVIRAGWRVHGGDIVLITHGRLAPEKGLEDLIDAMEILKSSTRRFVLVLVGAGVLRQQLEQRVRAKAVEDHVRFLGFQTDIPELLCAADIVVLPTWREGLSIALLEAMACGRPVVTTAIGSNMEATADGDAALLVPRANPSLLVDAINRLAQDSSFRDQLAAKARRRYLKEYTIEKMLIGYHNLYQELIKEAEDAQPVSSVLSS
jgi:glycosyltransferase involved in cell wall biosynthesis